MTSPNIEKHTLPSTCNNTHFKSDQPMLSYQTNNPCNLNFSNCNNTNDTSNLLALNMINQALNLLPQNSADKQLKISSLQFPEIQKMTERGGQGGLLMSEYVRVKTRVDQSGLLSPRESLVTVHRGQCFWAGCTFRNDIEDNFKKHMNECHQLTSSALAQVEISLEKSLQLSALLLKEQNHLYNMLLHLDQKMKCLPGEYSPLTDYHYLALLLNKFKQTPNMVDLISESNRVNNGISPINASAQLPLHTNNHHIPHPQYPSNITKPQPNLSQQFIDNLSSALLRQQPLHLPNQTPNYLQTIFSSSQTTPTTYSFNNNILPVIKSDNNNSTFVLNTALNTPPSDAHNFQLNNIDSNLKDILSQSRSSDSNYPRSDSATSAHIKEKKSKSERRTPDDQRQLLSKNMSDREYYRQYAVRPSASYVNLIKTAILESTRRELSLNEIYVWMQSEFSYFRDKEQKWKNAIRHNLSLHKCFQRKHGKLWTFNEKEYNLKKSRKIFFSRFQYNIPISGSETANVDGDNFDDDDDHIDVNENLNGFIKKELEYNDENRPDDIALDTDEWSNYLQKNSLKSSSSIVDMSMLPNLRTDKCPAIDN